MRESIRERRGSPGAGRGSGLLTASTKQNPHPGGGGGTSPKTLWQRLDSKHFADVLPEARGPSSVTGPRPLVLQGRCPRDKSMETGLPRPGPQQVPGSQAPGTTRLWARCWNGRSQSVSQTSKLKSPSPPCTVCLPL